jgi:hypothetical protein
MNKGVPATSTEYIIDLRSLSALGIREIGYVAIATIGFDTELDCEVDYLDFSEEPFEKTAADAIMYP